MLDIKIPPAKETIILRISQAYNNVNEVEGEA